MALWLRNSYDPFTPYTVDNVMGDVEREFRRLNREFNRLERDMVRQTGAPLGSLLARNTPMLPTFVTGDKGQQMAQFQFDTTGFQPDDITIETKDGQKLIVTAKHEDKSEDHCHYREFRRIVSIPEGTNVEQMQSRLAPNGTLTIQAPYQALAIKGSDEKLLQIKHEKTGDKSECVKK